MCEDAGRSTPVRAGYYLAPPLTVTCYIPALLVAALYVIHPAAPVFEAMIRPPDENVCAA